MATIEYTTEHTGQIHGIEWHAPAGFVPGLSAILSASIEFDCNRWNDGERDIVGLEVVGLEVDDPMMHGECIDPHRVGVEETVRAALATVILKDPALLEALTNRIIESGAAYELL